MSSAGSNWTRDELIVAFNLYCKTSFGKLHRSNPDTIALAAILGRTSSAVAMKLTNFARLDPELKKRNVSGMGHGSKLDEQIWEEFHKDWNRLSFESERLLIILKTGTDSGLEVMSFPEGKSREAIVMVRVNQAFFRSTVLAAYNSTCCITGLAIPALLNASHIVPWSIDGANRTNPRNGLCLNALHDRAFDTGLISLDSEFRVMVSPRLKKKSKAAPAELILRFEKKAINIPAHFSPDPALLAYHRDNIFQA